MLQPGSGDSPDAAVRREASPGSTELDSDLPREAERLDAGAEAMRARLAGRLFDERRPLPRLGRFEILHVLGRGGLGVVYAARDPKLGRLVALKVLHERDQGRRQRRVLREAQTLARLNHPNVVAVYEVGQGEDEGDESAVFIAMEYVEGVTLRERQASSLCGPSEILRLYLAAARGLHAAHMQGIVHRDFKPANVLVGLDGRARVADFGLALEGSEAPQTPAPLGPDIDSDDGPRSTIRAWAGTPRFMSPEQFAGAGVDARSDQFSFCVALYEALFGVFPYEVQDLRDNGATPALRPPTRSGPAWARKILQRGLALDPEARFGSMDALVSRLSRGAEGHRRRYVALGLAASAGAIILGSNAFATEGSQCADVSTLLDATWGDARRTTVSAAINKREEAYAGLAAKTVVEGFDLYAARWIDARHAACEGRAAAPDAPRATAAGAVRCLDRARARFHFAVEFASEPRTDGGVVAGADAILSGLDSPQACLERLAKEAALPVADGEKLARVQRQIDRADFLRFTAMFPQSAASARTAIQESLAIGAAAHTARAYLALGLAERRMDSSAAAASSLFEALAWAERSDAAHVSALAWQELTHISAFDLEDAVEAKQRLQMAAAVIERLGSPPRLIALGHQAAGEVALLEGRTASAIESFAESVERFSGLPDATPIEIATALTRHANAYAESGNSEDARRLYDRALEIRRERQGHDHPAVAAVEFNLALEALGAGEPDRAVDLLAHVVAVEIESQGQDSLAVAKTSIAQAMALWALDRLDEGLAKANLADSILRKKHPRGHSERLSGLLLRASLELEVGAYATSRASHAEALREMEAGDATDEAELRNNLGWLANAVGDSEAAAAHATRALELIGPGDPRWPYPAGVLGASYVAQGRWSEASVLLEQGLVAAERAGPDADPALVPELQWYLALALAGEGVDPARVRKLARSALDSVEHLQRGADARADLEPLVKPIHG